MGSGSKAVSCDLQTQAIISLSRGVKSNDQKIVGYIDSSRVKCENATKIFGGNIFNSIKDAIDKIGKLNVIISTPDKMHFNHIMETLKHDTSGILAEKPIALKLSEANQIKNEVIHKGIKFEVNYFRRFLPSYINIRNNIRDQKYGKFIFGRGIYDKGLKHNGSHLLNLLLFFFGEANINAVMSRKKCSLEDDANYSFELEFPELSDGRFIVQYGDSSIFTIFELELYFSNKVIKIVDFGRKIEFYDPVQDVIPGYISLNKTNEVYTEYMESAYYSIRAYLESADYDGLEDAVRVIEMCEEISNQYESSGMRL